jgi:hypothetical protein
MKQAAKDEIRARCNQKIDLRAITGEQAVYAVLDRAMLWGELENSMGGKMLRDLAIVGSPTTVISGSLWLFHAPLWAVGIPIELAVVLLAVRWLRGLLTLAHEGVEARIVASMSSALNPPPPNPNEPPISLGGQNAGAAP